MSLATLHTDARRVAVLIRLAPARIAARLFGIDTAVAVAMHDWLTAGTADKGDVPPAFTGGAASACFALVKISVEKPALFWAALVSIPSFPVLLALRWV
ncbi:hypothetical protein D9X30_1672 (plasmid) [Cupriavidus sp. U2]|uniref:hypothetical protein n=1 Tax=Cupriavidus sp. U2 TaxID=2920269 RepID=UPI00129E0339|nr:hypothetical protein [Cupriavidus sp. U2]KAI3593362.1 hypothetical protein D9X30_1672 [Cupriavidus sp. U2]